MRLRQCRTPLGVSVHLPEFDHSIGTEQYHHHRHHHRCPPRPPWWIRHVVVVVLAQQWYHHCGVHFRGTASTPSSSLWG